MGKAFKPFDTYKKRSVFKTMISVDLDYMKKKTFQELRKELGDVEKKLKAMIKSLNNKHLNP
jgi:transposase